MESRSFASFDDSDSEVSDEWGTDSELEIIGDLSLMFSDKEDHGSEDKSFITAPQTPSPKKRRSPASKVSQMDHLLQHQQKLVIQKGLPKSKLPMNLM